MHASVVGTTIPGTRVSGWAATVLGLDLVRDDYFLNGLSRAVIEGWGACHGILTCVWSLAYGVGFVSTARSIAYTIHIRVLR